MFIQLSKGTKRKLLINLKSYHHAWVYPIQKVDYEFKLHKRHKSSYSNTVILPKTSFPQRLEGPKRIELDEEIIDSKEYKNFYSWQKDNLSDRPKYVLHDGPPYANGEPHIGHAVNKILKDITTRCKLLAGFTVRYRPGWDCHGLPIELKAVTTSENVALAKESPLKLREIARQFADQAIEKQKKAFMSWGVFGDWKNPYKTMSSELVKRQIEAFFSMYNQGYIYQRYMPVYWSPSSKTALAESELEYNPQHKSTSIYVRFSVDKANKSIPKSISSNFSVYLLIWTTTPWSLIANRAVCFNSALEYCYVKSPTCDEYYIIAKETLYKSDDLKNIFGSCPDIHEAKLTEADLIGLMYQNPTDEFEEKNEWKPIYPASHVTAESGTGLVHTAPAHGPEDYLVGVSNQLDLSCPIDENGCYDSTVPKLEGLYALEEGNSAILNFLKEKGHILSDKTYIHSYPYDWRTKKPVLLRASKQWFIDTGKLQPRALVSLEDVKIHPKSAANGFIGILEKRPYWCISRQRVWGVPIPVFYNDDKVVISRELINRYHELIDSDGPDFWWKLEKEQILGGLNLSDHEHMSKGQDILDVWFDSGITWYSDIEADQETSLKQSDVYLEGLDQFSGWFYSSLLTSIAIQNATPYKKLYVHGFTLDEQGNKMSKSLGNVVSPYQITHGWTTATKPDEENDKKPKNKLKKTSQKKSKVYGVDVLRWWIAANASQNSAIYVGENILSQTKLEVDRLRNVFRFLLGNLPNDMSAEDLLSYQELLPLDRFILHSLTLHCKQVNEFYNQFLYNKVVQQTQFFVGSILSSFYFDLLKDRLYCDLSDSRQRKSADTVMFHVLNNLKASISPILPVLCREISLHSNLPNQSNESSLFYQYSLDERWLDDNLQVEIEFLMKFKEDIKNLLKDALSVEDAILTKDLNKLEVIVLPSSTNCKNILMKFGCDELREILQVSAISICESNSEFENISQNVVAKGYELGREQILAEVKIVNTTRKLCPRCRLYLNDNENTDDSLCQRCENVLQSCS